jgi:hypothetical protein
MIYFIRDLGLHCCLRSICPVLKRGTKEREKQFMRRDILIEKGPMREFYLQFSIDSLDRHFSCTFYD